MKMGNTIDLSGMTPLKKGHTEDIFMFTRKLYEKRRSCMTAQ